MNEAELETYRAHRRWDRMGRLVGDDAMARLWNARVLVVGLGGVGSWAAEAIARAGVGKISVVDFDSVCVTNTNRQLHALQNLVGKPKAAVMAGRLAQISPAASIESFPLFYDEKVHDEIFASRPDFVIDAIDSVTAKCALLARCRAAGIGVVTSTGSGGRLDPTKVKTADLGETEVDPLARDLRRILRQKYGFPAQEGARFGITAVYSDEFPTKPKELTYDNGKGFRCVCPQGGEGGFTCEGRNLIMGTAGFVTGAFGLAAAGVAVRALLESA